MTNDDRVRVVTASRVKYYNLRSSVSKDYDNINGKYYGIHGDDDVTGRVEQRGYR